jgi:hypothetical protein
MTLDSLASFILSTCFGTWLASLGQDSHLLFVRASCLKQHKLPTCLVCATLGTVPNDKAATL